MQKQRAISSPIKIMLLVVHAALFAYSLHLVHQRNYVGGLRGGQMDVSFVPVIVVVAIGINLGIGLFISWLHHSK